MTHTTGLLLALTILLGILYLPACSPFQSDTQDSEPPSSPEPSIPTSNDFHQGVVTPGYTLFQGDTEGRIVSFEYPESWRFDGLYTINNKAGISLKFGSDSAESYVAIETMALPYNESPIDFENVHDLLQEQIWWHSSFAKNPDQSYYDEFVPPPDLIEGTIYTGGR